MGSHRRRCAAVPRERDMKPRASNNRFESARIARPTRNGEAPLLAAQP
jgi:hypothetical protein